MPADNSTNSRKNKSKRRRGGQGSHDIDDAAFTGVPATAHPFVEAGIHEGFSAQEILRAIDYLFENGGAYDSIPAVLAHAKAASSGAKISTSKASHQASSQPAEQSVSKSADTSLKVCGAMDTSCVFHTNSSTPNASLARFYPPSLRVPHLHHSSLSLSM